MGSDRPSDSPGDLGFSRRGAEPQVELVALTISLVSGSEAKFEEGPTNNTNGDKYVLATTILASVLFLAGISSVLQTHRVRSAPLVSGAALWIGAVSYLATISRRVDGLKFIASLDQPNPKKTRIPAAAGILRVGLRGFEPPTFGPPDRRANQAAPQPV